jgi:hypothetical protein
MVSVGEVLEGDDGVEVNRRVPVFTEREWERYILIEGKHFIGNGGWNVQEDKDFITLTDVGSVNLEEVLGVVRNKVNIVVTSRILSSIKNYLELGFGKERYCKALVLELLEGVKEDGDAAVHGSDSFMEDCVN